MPSRLREPVLEIALRESLPYLVEHWYLGSPPRRYMMVRRFREVLEHARLEPGLRVLDLGCGWAFGTHWAREIGCTAVGIDLGMDQLQWARKTITPANPLMLALANARELPFPDASFDRAVSVEMMEHVFRPDRPKVLAEIARVLKPGARFAISTPNAGSPIEVVKRAAVRWPLLRRSLPSSCFPEAADDRGAYHPYRYHHPLPLGELRAGAEAAGLRVEGARRFLWVMKTLPGAALAAGRAAEAVAEALPLVNRLGATTLIWGVRSGA
jgi:SAM-dependent methyltransferase